MPKAKPITVAKRPAETVRTYIETEFLTSGVSANTRLPTIEEFSKHLNVSPSTVRSVLKALSQEGKLETIPGKGTFLTQLAEDEPKTSLHNCIGVNVKSSINSGHAWGRSILIGVTDEALRAHMMVTTLDISQVANIRKAISGVDGIIAFPRPGLRHNSHELDRACLERKMPLVHINPTHFHATSNFVSNDFFTFAYNLALAWRQTGRRRVVVAIGSPVQLSVSAAQVSAAFSLAYADCPDARLVIMEEQPPIPPGDEPDYHRQLGRYLMGKYFEKYGPKDVDAVYGFGDWTAEGAVHALMEAGLKVPTDVSVVGGTGMNVVYFDFGPLVTMQQPMQEIGEAAVKMLMWRIANQNFDAPGAYLMPQLSEGATLRPEERSAYEQLLKQEKELA